MDLQDLTENIPQATSKLLRLVSEAEHVYGGACRPEEGTGICVFPISSVSGWNRSFLQDFLFV